MEFQKGTAQGTGGQHVDISSAADVHVVPINEKHEVSIIAMSDTAGTITTKVNGESVGCVEAVVSNTQKLVFTGIVIGDSGGSAVNCTASGSPTIASARAIVRKVS